MRGGVEQGVTRRSRVEEKSTSIIEAQRGLLQRLPRELIEPIMIYCAQDEISKMPIDQGLGDICRLEIGRSFREKLFKETYPEEFLRLKKVKNNEQVINYGLLDTKERLDRKVMHDLKERGLLVNLISNEEDSGTWRSELELLDNESPYENYSDQEYETALSLGWQERGSMIYKMYENTYSVHPVFNNNWINSWKNNLQQSWQNNPEQVWQQNEIQIRNLYSINN